MASFGEYSDLGLIGKANMNYLLEEYSDLPGILTVVGDMSSETIAIDVRLLLIKFYEDQEEEESQVNDFLEAIASLSDYPLLNEDIHHGLLREAEEESWEDWVKDEFLSDIAYKFDFDVDLIDLDSNKEQDDKLSELFDEIIHEQGIEFDNEQGGDMYIEVSHVVSFVKRQDVQFLLDEVES